jgi:hypothetical protein
MYLPLKWLNIRKTDTTEQAFITKYKKGLQNNSHNLSLAGELASIKVSIFFHGLKEKRNFIRAYWQQLVGPTTLSSFKRLHQKLLASEYREKFY